MKDALKVTLFFVLVLTNIARSFEDQQKSAEKRSSAHLGVIPASNDDVDINQQFLAVLQSLGSLRLNQEITQEQYSAKLGQVREAVLAKKRSEQRKRKEENLGGVTFTRNIFRPEPAQKQNPERDDVIAGLNKMLNILDTLVKKTYVPKTTTQDILTEIQKVLSMKESDPATRRSDPKVTEKKMEDIATQATLSTSTSTTTKTTTVSIPQSNPHLEKPAHRPYKHQTERDVSKYNQGQPGRGGMLPIRARGMKPRPLYSNQFDSGFDGGESELYPERNGASADYELEEYTTRRSSSGEEYKRGGKRFKGISAGQENVHGDESSSGKQVRYEVISPPGNETSDLTNEDDNDHHDEEDGGDSMLDTLILIMVAVLATQLCFLCVLVAFRDKIVSSLTLKYGQIKICDVPRPRC